jgi:hypothetical protein
MVENERKGAIWMANNLTRIPEDLKAPVTAVAPPTVKKQRKPRVKKAKAGPIQIKEGEVVVSFN